MDESSSHDDSLGSMSPQVSIITATRNALAHLPRLAEALLVPENDVVEWIVVDALSTDGTAAYLAELGDARLKWISEPDSGIYDAWNKGVALATGRWILFVGADDLVSAQWLRVCAELPDADLAYGDVDLVDPSGSPIARLRARPWADVRRVLRSRLLLAHPGLAHHRSLFVTRRFDTTYRIAGDFAFLAAAELHSAWRLSVVQAVVRLGGISNCAAHISNAYRENLRVLQEHGTSMPPRDRLLWAFKRMVAGASPRLFGRIQSLGWRLRKHP